MRIGPAPSDQPPMPGEQRLRLNEECVPAAARQHPAEGGEQQPVVRLKPRPVDLAAKDRDLVAEDKDLELLRSVAAAEEHDQFEQAADNDVEGGHKQRRPPTDGAPDATA